MDQQTSAYDEDADFSGRMGQRVAQTLGQSLIRGMEAEVRAEMLGERLGGMRRLLAEAGEELADAKTRIQGLEQNLDEERQAFDAFDQSVKAERAARVEPKTKARPRAVVKP